MSAILFKPQCVKEFKCNMSMSCVLRCWYRLDVLSSHCKYCKKKMLCSLSSDFLTWNIVCGHGPLARYVKLRVPHAPGVPGTYSPPPRVSDPDMHHGTCVTHVPWCMPGSRTSGFLWSRWRGKRYRHSRRMHIPQFTYLVRGPLCGFPWLHRYSKTVPRTPITFEYAWSQAPLTPT